MNLQTLNNTLHSCFQELTTNMSDEKKQLLFREHLKKITDINYETYKFPKMIVKIIKQ